MNRRTLPPRSTTRRVRPNRSLSPGNRGANGPLCPFTNVPCLDSRSRTTNRPLTWLISQWRRLTHGSRRRISQSASLPTMAGRRSRRISDAEPHRPGKFNAKLMFRETLGRSRANGQEAGFDLTADQTLSGRGGWSEAPPSTSAWFTISTTPGRSATASWASCLW